MEEKVLKKQGIKGRITNQKRNSRDVDQTFQIFIEHSRIRNQPWIWSYHRLEIVVEEVEEAIMTCANGKALGIDDIANELIKYDGSIANLCKNNNSRVENIKRVENQLYCVHFYNEKLKRSNIVERDNIVSSISKFCKKISNWKN